MQWLINDVDARISSLAPGMFSYLELTTSRRQLGWIHQLSHMSRGFIQALLARVASCGRRSSDDYAYYRDFTRHARLEMLHPIELEDWAVKFGIVGIGDGPDPGFCQIPATPETDRLISFCRSVADSGSPDEQVVAMNIVAEGVAYRFFSAASGVVRRMGMRWGRFWRDHDDDLEHARIGVSRIGDVDADSEDGARLRAVACRALDLFHDALESWWRSPDLDRIISPGDDPVVLAR